MLATRQATADHHSSGSVMTRNCCIIHETVEHFPWVEFVVPKEVQEVREKKKEMRAHSKDLNKAAAPKMAEIGAILKVVQF